MKVGSTPGRNAGAAAEHAIALMMAALRKLPQLQRTLEQGQWRSDLYAYDECGGELDGSTVGLDELLTRSDVVSLHARLTDETCGLIGADQLARMPRGAVLVNSARGGLLDYEATVDALESGQLGAAAFDVFPAEPVPEGSRLLTAPNVVMTPHLAGVTRQTAHRAAALAAEAVAAFLTDREPAGLQR